MSLDETIFHREYEKEKSKNRVVILGGKLGLEAIEDKIIIQLDRFKSGYECKTCNGVAILDKCICVGKDYPAGTTRLGGICKVCHGNPDTVVGQSCPDCKGKGATIIIPEAFKQLPTSGIIVSVGPMCKHRKIGERVLFGAHTGYFIPFKGNVKIRCMREDEILCLMYSKSDDFNIDDLVNAEELD